MGLAIADIERLFAEHGHIEYGGEGVTQLEHSLQTACLAERAGAAETLVTAAFLHDLGHLLNLQGDTPSARGIDDQHQYFAIPFLRPLFPPAVIEPIRLHVDAKRSLCATDAGYREARRLVTNGSLGTLYVVRLAGHDPAPPHEEYIPQSGGIFNDFSVHDFDVTRWLTGQEFEEVYADGGVLGFPMFAKYDDVDTAVATMRLSGGTRAILSVARHDPLGYDIRTELFGSGDSVSVGLGPQTPMRSVEPGVPPPAGPAWQMFIDRFRPAYQNELRAFLRVARGEEESACTARDGLEAVRVAVAATRSLREHRPVRISEVT